MSKESFLTSLSFTELKELCTLHNVPHTRLRSKIDLITLLHESPNFKYTIGMTAPPVLVSTVETILCQPSPFTDYLIYFQNRFKSPQSLKQLGAVADTLMMAMNTNDELSMFYRGMPIDKFFAMNNLINNGSFCISTTDLTAAIYYIRESCNLNGLRRLLSSPTEFTLKNLQYILEAIISIDTVPTQLEMVDFKGIEATMRALGYPGCCGIFDFWPFIISSVLVGYVLVICDGNGYLRWRQLIIISVDSHM